ncbi:hypothetical protein BV898_06689 [Hypsibius exemplaris]|uniref:Secreted protein n=1 Tax=Hypsibius exemplaris TaxID=2072580 RepID=A0A1W0WVP6_HYPEX|nr:hypothetical protein BV898_06689 [Hypsibius exemplaris]
MVWLLALGVLLVLIPANGELELESNRQQFYFRIETELLYFENTNNSLATGKRCDVYSKCDPVFYGYLDLEKPDSPWPGSIRRLQDHQYLSGHKNIDSAKLNHAVTKDLCGGLLSRINLRVEVFDHDLFTKSDLIEQYECPFVPDLVGANNHTALWSAHLQCRTLHQPQQHKLAYRWRVYRITPHACGLKT